MSLLAEAKRKAIHFSSSWVPVAYYLLPEYLGKSALLVAAGIFLTLDMLRIHEPRLKTVFYRFFGDIVREHEKTMLLGSTSLVIAALLTVYCFQKNIAAAALLYLTIGDSMAALIGKTYGRTYVFGKTLEGSLACFVSCVLIGLLVPDLPPDIVVVGALVATTFELLPIPIDDNFRIPLSAGFVMQILMPH
ncbi:MAG: phosphatidate cytidylyltransferase [Candidatus Eisenbacteria bacterium]|nr:phosphatidate cytidylyltransferase [Candidatus Eisenbacteria bacterium]